MVKKKYVRRLKEYGKFLSSLVLKTSAYLPLRVILRGLWFVSRATVFLFFL